MKYILHLLLIAVTAVCLFVSCGETQSDNSSWSVPEPQDVVMYQVNPRVFAECNSFKAVERHLDSIKALGTNVVWFMPIYETGVFKGKNSPYCIKNYCAVNPEYGTVEDFKSLIEACHKRSMIVIADWVANHTSWDNAWVSEHPDWYTRNEKGEIIYPAGTNWEDVADLDFSNPEMCQAMIDAMKWWVTEIKIDGFRCDAADFVPYEFWKDCIGQLRAIPDRKLLMLAEGMRKDHFEAGFQMDYAWEFATTMRKVYGNIPGGKLPACALFAADSAEYAGIPEGCVKLRFTTNHDECDKMSPVREYHGDQGSLAAFVAATYLHGGALLYGSQEVAYPGRINFFHYVHVDWSANSDMYETYRRILKAYNDHPAIRKGALTAYPHNEILAFSKSLDDETVLVLVNLSQEGSVMELPADLAGKTCTDLISGKTAGLPSSISLDPYAFLVLK